MTDHQQELSLRVRSFIEQTQQDFFAAMETDDLQELERAVIASLKRLADEFGTMDYGFNLSIERYIERFCGLIQELLPGILDRHLPRYAALASISDATNIAFVAYYGLSLIYKKEGSEEKLRSLMGEKYTFFTQYYPLAFEVRSRYHKRVREYEQALDSDELAIDFMQTRGVQNYALCISYASTVCRMFEMGYAVEAGQCSRAEQYIVDAINYKPDYPKYHFLRGKLLFYSGRDTQNLKQFQAICKEALVCVKKARMLQMGQTGAHFEKALWEYNDLIAKITQELRNREDQSLTFRHMSERELREQISKVLSSTDASAIRPPNPKLKPGQKFVFISYSHQDYQSVYCDLLSLYAQKVPFQYDGDLPMGKRWDDEVHDYISKEECVGVIFFLSQNTLLSEAIEKECRLALEASRNGKRYFSVNLEGRMPPSEILMNSISTHGIPYCLQSHVDSERMVGFLTTFHDHITFVPKFHENGPAGNSHIPELINSIKKTFPMLEIGERGALPAGV